MKRLACGACVFAAFLGFGADARAAASDTLLQNFRSPPPEALPRVWWHWMNGNVTPQGIQADLDWMRSVGIGGVNAIDASIDTPQVVKNRLIYMTPEWKAAFRHAAAITGKYGMELSVDSSPGWSETGGPWVSPAAAMKKLVWSRTEIEGAFHGKLSAPPSVPGPFQNIAKGDPAYRFYRDSLVIAYRLPVSETIPSSVTSNGGSADKADLTDGDLANGPRLKPPPGSGDVWVRVDYSRPQTVQGLTISLSTNDGLGFAARIECSDDGERWRSVTGIPKPAQVRRFALPQQTISFAPVTARFFRLVVEPDAPLPTSLRTVERAPGAVATPVQPPPKENQRFYKLAELMFHAAATVNEFEKKAGFAIARDNYAIASEAPIAPGSAVDPTQVMNVTSHMKPDGSFDWAPPPGRWVILRMGNSPTGTENHPATKEATGLEVDKLSRSHVHDYLEHYLDTYADAAGPALFGAHGLGALTVDSTEIGAQNWTETMLADFQRLRGYDPTPWLPALTGVVVGSVGESDRFLWDFRRTIAELLARNHYGEIARVAHEHGLTNYGEALEDHRPTFGDDIEMRRFASIPMAAMWTYGTRREPLPTYVADIEGAASVAHLYGQNLVAAESLTSAGQPWAYGPRMLKPVVDMEFALGVNRIVIHTSVHQPMDRPPGLSLGGYGQFFNRLESWAGQAGGWIRYIARCSQMLQQGRYVADVAYFYGEEAPITGLFGDATVSDVPRGHGFDFVNADAVKNLLSVDKGELVAHSGMRYRLLYLGGSSRFMTLPVLQHIRDLMMAGAVVVGRRPQSSPSLADDPGKFSALADQVFGHGDHVGTLGRGRVFTSGSLAEALSALKLAPDVEFAGDRPDTEILSIHRHLPEAEIYFLTNRLDRPENVAGIFRVGGLNAQLWNPVTGDVQAVAQTAMDGRTRLSLSLPSYGSIFVVFRKTDKAVTLATHAETIQVLDDSWMVSFQRGRGGPVQPVAMAPGSWSVNPDSAIRYFSGTATYTKDFDMPKLAAGKYLLDLGAVREVADVSVNGKRLGTVWTPPYSLDISDVLHAGRNHIAVEVSNLWVNRLIGDAQPNVNKKVAFTTVPTYRPDSPLRLSGLLGPVKILNLVP
jgi:hypothetical protein